MSARLYALSSSVAACRYNPKLQQQLEEHVAEQVRWTAMASAAAAAGLRLGMFKQCAAWTGEERRV